MTIHTAKSEHRCMFCRMPILPTQRYAQLDRKPCHLSCTMVQGMEIELQMTDQEFMKEWLAVEAGLFVRGKD